MIQEYELNKAIANGEVFVPLTVVSTDIAGNRNKRFEKLDVFEDCETPSCVGGNLELTPCETYDVPLAPFAYALTDDDDTLIDLSEMEEAE